IPREILKKIRQIEIRTNLGIILCLALVVRGALMGFSANAPDTGSLRVVIKPTKTDVRLREPFNVELRVENQTTINQTARVMNCSWDEHWKSSSTNVSWLGWDCSKNFAVDVEIPPGGAYTNNLDIVIPGPVSQKTILFRMGFTPMDCQTTFWSDAVKLDVLPSDIQASERPDKLLLGTWRESNSTNTIEFLPQTAVLAPILKMGYAIRGSQLVFTKPGNVVIEKLDMEVRTNRTVVKELRTHNEPPYTDVIVPFHVTQQELEITWDGKPMRYVRVSK
ncbi:MAG: hypothetical protein ABI042_08120, partial [Verrucomicrobiota bacterium]